MLSNGKNKHYPPSQGNHPFAGISRDLFIFFALQLQLLFVFWQSQRVFLWFGLLQKCLNQSSTKQVMKL